jgi:hypothetical protein
MVEKCMFAEVVAERLTWKQRMEIDNQRLKRIRTLAGEEEKVKPVEAERGSRVFVEKRR